MILTLTMRHISNGTSENRKTKSHYTVNGKKNRCMIPNTLFTRIRVTIVCDIHKRLNSHIVECVTHDKYYLDPPVTKGVQGFHKIILFSLRRFLQYSILTAMVNFRNAFLKNPWAHHTSNEIILQSFHHRRINLTSSSVLRSCTIKNSSDDSLWILWILVSKTVQITYNENILQIYDDQMYTFLIERRHQWLIWY